MDSYENKQPPDDFPTAILTSDTNTRILAGYQFGKTIGKGTFGKVKLGKHILTGQKVAIKILQKSRIVNQADRLRVVRQLQILRKIRHPNIIQLYEIIETKKCIYLIMQYAGGGELFDYIVSNTRLREPEAARILQQILNAVEYLHKLGIVHRDLKPENLLFDAKRNVKVVDFGLGNIYAKGEELRTACGSPCYAAPEMVTARPYHGLQTDIWSCGIILYAMCCGYLPFDDPNTSQLYRKIAQGRYQLPQFCSPTLDSVLSHILNTNPQKRSTIKQIRQHPFCLHSKTPIVDGIIFGVSCIPVEHFIINKLQKLRVDITGLLEYIQNNKHNSLSASYYLLLTRELSERGEDILTYYTAKQDFIHKYRSLNRLEWRLEGGRIDSLASRAKSHGSPVKNGKPMGSGIKSTAAKSVEKYRRKTPEKRERSVTNNPQKRVHFK